MKKSTVLFSYILAVLMVGGLVAIIYFPNFTKPGSFFNNNTNNTNVRSLVQVPINADKNNSISVPGTKLPQFVFDLTAAKFKKLGNITDNGIVDHITATIVHQAYANAKLDSAVSLNEEKHQLVVSPKDIPNFRPGKYKLMLQLRTLQGVVNVEQDFTWGVIAVNTNKSIYKPGETAQIGLGVLNDKGDTLCKMGLFNHVDDLSMTITDPQGKVTNLSIKDNTIRDSGGCGVNTVTNAADFQASYPTTTAGIYQMKVTAVVYGKSRTIEDYFKVDPNVQFDVERTSFPTRIYPPAPYPVTFTVTAKQDYHGRVEDVVPSSFNIEHIDDNGNQDRGFDYTKIYWNTDLKAGVPKTFTYLIKFPMVSPEFYMLGPIKIGDFEEARQWQIASDAINSSTGLVTYEDNGSSATWYRTWTGSAFNGQLSMSATPADSRWFAEKSNPITGEKLEAVLDNTGPDTIYVFRWNGSTWTQDFTVTSNVSTSRKMDLGYEQISGNAIFVYSDATNTIKYRKRVNNVWDGADSTAGTATAPKSWIKLVSQKSSDSIMLGYVNTSNRVGAMLWDGNGWIDELVDSAGGSPTLASGNAEETFGVAWETQTGVPMIMWANNNKDITYRRLVSNAWSAEATIGTTSYAANVDWVNAASDDTASSNNIAIGTMNTGASAPNCDFAIWNGSSWTKGSSIACRSNADRGINVAWEHNDGQAVWVYNSNAATTQLSYRTWTSGGGFTTGSTVDANIETTPLSIQMYSDPNSVGIIIIYDRPDTTTPANAALWDREWNGSSWSGPGGGNGGAPLHTAIQASSGENDEAFAYGFDLNLETLAAYRWFNDTPATDLGGSISPLTAQDTPYTLTTGGQLFRLIVLIYYPDALPTSLSRQYDLQFVDPGSGTCSSPTGGTPSTWTNVPTSGSQISFNDNATIASGDNIATNAADPTFRSLVTQYQDYQESNTFTNSRTNIVGNQNGIWDFSLKDNTTFDRVAQSFCFRVIRSSGLVLQINKYPQLTTAAVNDVIIQGHAKIQGGTKLQ